MMSLVLSQPHGAVLTKSARRKIATAGMTKAKAAEALIRLTQITQLSLVLVIEDSGFGLGAGVGAGIGVGVGEGEESGAGRRPSFHTRQPITPTSAIVAGNVRPKL